jgi:hypothetical protein
MYCPKCGAQNDDNVWKCVQCGAVLHQQSQQQTPPPLNIPTYLAQAILCTIFCCLPFGIVAIIYSTQVNSKMRAGDLEGAQKASKRAATWCWVSFGIGLVVMMLGIVSSIAVPNLLTAIQRSKRSRTVADMRALGTALGSFQIDKDTFPVQSPEQDWNDELLPAMYYQGASKDAWETPFRYWSDGEGYTLTSYGKDRQKGGGESGMYEFDADIIYINGSFVAPEVVRSR